MTEKHINATVCWFNGACFNDGSPEWKPRGRTVSHRYPVSSSRMRLSGGFPFLAYSRLQLPSDLQRGLQLEE